MIRPALFKSVYDALGHNKYLSAEDFEVTEYSGRTGEPCIKIAYRYSPNITFAFHIPKEKTKLKEDYSSYYLFTCTARPGAESVEESIKAQERTGLTGEIRDWVDRVYDDIVAALIQRHFEQQSSAIDQLRARMEEISDEPISESEIAELKEALEKVRTELTEQLRQESKDKDLLKEQIDSLSRDIEFLKATLNSTTKRKWAEMAYTRLKTLKSKLSLRHVAVGAKLLKYVLPESVSEELDTVADAAQEVAEILESPPTS